MYFYRTKQKVILDLHEDFILTRSPALCIGKTNNASPSKVVNAAGFVVGIGSLNRRQKIQATRAAIRFIWKSKPSEVEL